MIRVHTFEGNWNLPDPIDERIKTTPEDHEPYEYQQWERRLRDQGYVIDVLPILYPDQVRRIRAVNRATDETAFYFASREETGPAHDYGEYCECEECTAA